jgi:hypothetical protein
LLRVSGNGYRRSGLGRAPAGHPGGGIDVWPVVADVIAPAAGILLLIVLGWAAVERGRIHRRWAQRRRCVKGDTAARIADWCMAAGAASGWV